MFAALKVHTKRLDSWFYDRMKCVHAVLELLQKPTRGLFCHNNEASFFFLGFLDTAQEESCLEEETCFIVVTEYR